MIVRFIVLAAVSVACGRRDAAAQELETTFCGECHDQINILSGECPPKNLLSRSVHADLDCTDCHADVEPSSTPSDTAIPHGESLEPVDCAECHEDEAEEYQWHGAAKVGESKGIPACWSCHGSHEILPANDPGSLIHPVNLPRTCRACHADVDVVEANEALRKEPILLYESSVHGRANRQGNSVAAVCTDCHANTNEDGQQTGHLIRATVDRASSAYHFNIPDTCGRCHEQITKDFWEGVHGKLAARGQVDSPVCTHCHGEHGIISPSDPRSPVSAARVAQETCARCHNSEVLNEKYGVPAGRLRSYVDTYHGLKRQAGDVHVANCASCHGVHRILPHTDPTSSIHPDNLQATCGECHPGISTELARTPIHESATAVQPGWPGFFTTVYMWLIPLTIGSMLLHNLADYVRHVQIMRGRPRVVRMTPNETFQHAMLAMSFIVLVVSGFSLRFSDAGWVRLMFGWGGGQGFVIRGVIHRVAAMAFGFTCVWHIVYLFTQRGRQALRDMLPGKHDALAVRDNARYFLGLRKNRPRFRRFSYMEKAEYWALVWGAIVMFATGALLWFDNFFVGRWGLPKVILDIGQVVHYYEAWLATLAILVWHGYAVLFSPHVYPMNPSWIAGTMPKDMYDHEHPAGPRPEAAAEAVPEKQPEEKTGPLPEPSP